MKNFTTTLLGFFMLFLGIKGTAQNHYHIRLNPLETSPAKQACFDIQLSSADGSDINLAGQNYRLYYDAEKFRFSNSASLLPKAQYGDAVIKDKLANIDAGGTGKLSYETHLGFVNLGIDLNDIQNGGIELPANGDWVSTVQICFEGPSEGLDLKDFRLDWARKELTKDYATAFVEVAEWISPNEMTVVIADKYYDLDLSTATGEQLLETPPIVYPNPTHNKLWIDSNQKAEMRLEIWDMSGRHLVERTVPSNTVGYEVNMKEYPAGMYQIKLSLDDKYFTKKNRKNTLSK